MKYLKNRESRLNTLPTATLLAGKANLSGTYYWGKIQITSIFNFERYTWLLTLSLQLFFYNLPFAALAAWQNATSGLQTSEHELELHLCAADLNKRTSWNYKLALLYPLTTSPLYKESCSNLIHCSESNRMVCPKKKKLVHDRFFTKSLKQLSFEKYF